MNELEQYFEKNDKRLINKYQHYFDVYDRHFSKYKGQEITIVEIGVFQGGSLQMWRSYFGPKAKIWGIDIDTRCKLLEEENTNIIIGSQEDENFLESIYDITGPIDILIDDGGHTQKQQITTFNILFDKIKDDGVYLCEDVHTSYWLSYGGGHKRKGTFVEFAKNLIDKLNAFHSEENNLQVDSFTKSAKSIHYYDSIVVIEKGIITKPTSKMTGVYSFENKNKITSIEKLMLQIIIHLNKLLRIFKLPGIYINKMIEILSKKVG
jgi:23S rRNA U2552 (ribose-2'-O)-methylase RlmE/FtsJ